MCKTSQNLCKSVIDDSKTLFQPDALLLSSPNHAKQWQDEVYLAPQCKERFLTLSDVPEFVADRFFMAGLAELSQGYHVERTGAGVHTLIYTLEGRGLLTTTRGQQVIEPFTQLIIPAEVPFRFELDSTVCWWKMVWVLLRPETKWQHLVQKGAHITPCHNSERIWSLADLIHCEIQGRDSFRRLLVTELNRLVIGDAIGLTQSQSRVQSLFGEIESQLHSNWTVKEMAKRCFISEEQLNRLCKNLFNLSPQQKLIQLRMEKAVDLLQHRGWSISMIALRLGYKEPHNFTHRFNRYYGISPTRYRKERLSND